MKSRIAVFCLALAACAGAAAAEPVTLYVAAGGNDRAAGGKSTPFATLERARDEIRRLQPGSATVWVRGGDYFREAPFELDARDNGTVYASWPGETVRLLGGRILREWRPVRDTAIVTRLAAEARRQVVVCDLKAAGVGDMGAFRSRGFGRDVVPAHLELFFQGKRMTVARWPDGEFTRIAGVGDAQSTDDQHGGRIGRLPYGFLYDGDRPSRWKTTEDVWVHGYWTWDWANTYEQVESIDTAARLVKTRPPHGMYGFRPKQRFYFLNVLEELDHPGEYYLDRKRALLYFWPPAPVESGEVAVSVMERPLVEIRGARDVTLRGFVVEYGRASGIVVTDGTNVRVAGSTARNLGNLGITVRGGSGCAVAACDVYHTGDGGIEVSGGDRKALTPAGHAALNNDVHHIAEWSRTYQPGIRVAGVGQRVAHNHVHDGPHTGILLGGNDHTVELNEIDHVCLETGDVGAFYMGRDYTERGNTVRHNFFHHTGGVGMGSMGVYLDDCASGTTVSGNVFYKVTRAAFLGGGRDHRIENNVFVECVPAVDIDGRGLDPKPVWHNMVYVTMKERLEEMRWREPPYSTRYPALASIGKYLEAGTGVPPEGNRVRRNIVKGAGARDGKWLRIRWRAEPGMLDIGDNLADEDPRFVDEAAMNFQLRDDSPAWRLGFERIPFEKIGLQLDEERKRLPGK